MPTTREEFEAVHPALTEAIVNHAKQYGMPASNVEWFERVS